MVTLRCVGVGHARSVLVEASQGETEVVTLGRETLRFSPCDTLDARIAAVTEEQHGVVSGEQLETVGLSASGVRSRVGRSRLFRVRRGVFALAPTLSALGPVAAAVLSCGSHACACHLTGAGIKSLQHDGRVLIDVAVPSPRGRGEQGLVTHSARRLRRCDVDVLDGIPVTSVARTLLDCAPVVGRRGTERLIQKAEWNGSFDLQAVRDLLAHVPGHRGSAILLAAIGDAAGAHGVTASNYEDDMLVALRAAGAREPECNPPIALGDGTFAYPDFLWRPERLAVELDPRSTHDRTASYRSDRRRDRALRRAAGIETMRFCDDDLVDPAACAAEVVGHLATRHEFRPNVGRNS